MEQFFDGYTGAILGLFGFVIFEITRLKQKEELHQKKLNELKELVHRLENVRKETHQESVQIFSYLDSVNLKGATKDD